MRIQQPPGQTSETVPAKSWNKQHFRELIRKPKQLVAESQHRSYQAVGRLWKFRIALSDLEATLSSTYESCGFCAKAKPLNKKENIRETRLTQLKRTWGGGSSLHHVGVGHHIAILLDSGRQVTLQIHSHHSRRLVWDEDA